MTDRRPRRVSVAAAVIGVSVLTWAALVYWDGDVGATLSPIIIFSLLFFMVRAPVRHSMYLLSFIALAVNNPQERPYEGLWENPPLSGFAHVFFTNLHNVLPLPVLRFSGLEFLLVFLTGVMVYRRITKTDMDPQHAPAPAPLRGALLLSFATLVGLELWGIARGGNIKESIWQFRVLLMVPLTGMLFAYGLRGAEDLRPMGRVVVAAAFVKVLTGAAFYHLVARPMGYEPSYVTTHTDSVLYVVAVCVVLATWWEAPTGRNLGRALWVLPVLFYGLVLNDRRLAYVSLAGTMVAVFLFSPMHKTKRFVTRALIFSLPLLLAYVAVGWNARSKVFKPVGIIRSVVVSDADEDGSTEFRDLENYNLIWTWRRNPFLGAGFGHPYEEETFLPDISKFMPNYRFLPHNSVLWLWSLGGWLGFTSLWLYLSATVFFAGRAYRQLLDPQARAAMLVVFAGVVTYLMQCFGDMGTQSYTGVFVVGACAGLAGRFATLSGAWDPLPRPARVPTQAPSLELSRSTSGAR